VVRVVVDPDLETVTVVLRVPSSPGWTRVLVVVVFLVVVIEFRDWTVTVTVMATVFPSVTVTFVASAALVVVAMPEAAVSVISVDDLPLFVPVVIVAVLLVVKELSARFALTWTVVFVVTIPSFSSNVELLAPLVWVTVVTNGPSTSLPSLFLMAVNVVVILPTTFVWSGRFVVVMAVRPSALVTVTERLGLVVVVTPRLLVTIVVNEVVVDENGVTLIVTVLPIFSVIVVAPFVMVFVFL
jgi:hypothetical protein